MAFRHMHHGMESHSHETVEQAYECEADYASYEAEAAAEMAMEARLERFWEEGTENQHSMYLWEVEQDERMSMML